MRQTLKACFLLLNSSSVGRKDRYHVAVYLTQGLEVQCYMNREQDSGHQTKNQQSSYADTEIFSHADTPYDLSGICSGKIIFHRCLRRPEDRGNGLCGIRTGYGIIILDGAGELIKKVLFRLSDDREKCSCLFNIVFDVSVHMNQS